MNAACDGSLAVCVFFYHPGSQYEKHCACNECNVIIGEGKKQKGKCAQFGNKLKLIIGTRSEGTNAYKCGIKFWSLDEVCSSSQIEFRPSAYSIWHHKAFTLSLKFSHVLNGTEQQTTEMI